MRRKGTLDNARTRASVPRISPQGPTEELPKDDSAYHREFFGAATATMNKPM
jgi:hypothetical protein